MAEAIKKAILGDVVFWVCLMVTLVLMLLGFYLPPMGEISPSVCEGCVVFSLLVW